MILKTTGLKKAYHGKQVVNGVSLEVKSGEIVGLLGPNGAGKTTTFYMIVGIIKPDSGSVFIDDQDISQLPIHRRARLGIQYLPQEPSVFRKLTVAENILAILQTLDLDKAARMVKLSELLKELKISHLANNKAYSLSGGERRRVEITRALVTAPHFILLDEPFAGIDPLAVNDIQAIIQNLKKKKLGILISDHNVRETLNIVDRAYLIFEGRVLREGTRDFLINDPLSRELYLGERFRM
jgi:lipopolysaccharide export system ATP-binding protein